MSQAVVSAGADVRARMVPVAASLARLCSAAQFFSGSPGDEEVSAEDMLPRLEAARDAVRRFHQAAAAGDEAEAEAILDRLHGATQGLARAIVDVDLRCPAADLEERLRGSRTLTADALARLVEFYAQVAPRTASGLRKLRVVARELARRERHAAGGAPDAAAVLRSFRRRGALAAAGTGRVEPARLERAAGIRARVLATGPEQAADLVALETETEILLEELGEALYAPAVLAEIVAIDLALQVKQVSIERCEARPFARVLNDFEIAAEDLQELLAATTGASQPSVPDAASPAGEDEDPDAIAQLAACERELVTAVADDTHAERGFHLDPEELAVVRGDGGDADPEWPAVTRRLLAARAAVDRLARRCARAHQPAGVEPPPLPVATAITLLRVATRLERDMDELIQAALLRGEYPRAKAATRTVHRLARARLGLALLGDLPASGWMATTDVIHLPAEDVAGDARDLEEEELKRRLAVARVMRDALVGKKDEADAAAEHAEKPPESHRPVEGKASASAAALRKEPGRASSEAAARRRTRLFGTLAVVSVLTVAFHAVRWSLPPDKVPLPAPKDFAKAAPLDSCAPLGKTFLANAGPEWSGADAAQKEEYVRRLYAEVRNRGFARLVVMSASGDRPLAFASSWELRIARDPPAPATPAPHAR